MTIGMLIESIAGHRRETLNLTSQPGANWVKLPGCFLNVCPRSGITRVSNRTHLQRIPKRQDS